MSDASSDAWLSLDAAAARLGVSRLRLREAIAAGILRGQRDNNGLWRVVLGATPDLARKIASSRLPADRLLEVMFDEIEELTSVLSDRNGDIERLGNLAARQQALLERAVTLTERNGKSRGDVERDVERFAALSERSQALVDRALTSLEKRDADLTQMAGLMDRALDAASGLDAEVERQRETSRRQRALLDRVFEIARVSLDRIGREGKAGWLGRFWGRKEGA